MRYIIKIKPPKDEFISVNQAISYVGVKNCTLSKWKNLGLLRYKKQSGRIFYLVEDLDRKIEAAKELGIKLNKIRKK